MKTLKDLVKRKPPNDTLVHTIKSGDIVVYADGKRGVVDWVEFHTDHGHYEVHTDIRSQQCDEDGVVSVFPEYSIVEIIFSETRIEKIAKVADKLALALNEADIASDYMGADARIGVNAALAAYTALVKELGGE